MRLPFTDCHSASPSTMRALLSLREHRRGGPQPPLGRVAGAFPEQVVSEWALDRCMGLLQTLLTQSEEGVLCSRESEKFKVNKQCLCFNSSLRILLSLQKFEP